MPETLLPRARICMSLGSTLIPAVPSNPVISSAPCGWNGIQLEGHKVLTANDSTGIIQGYQVCLFLSDSVTMNWSVNGRCASGLISRRQLCLATHGELRRAAWNSGFEVLVICLAPTLMHDLSAEIGGGKPVEIIKHRNLDDDRIVTVLRALQADVVAGSPAGPLFGEQLGVALATYLRSRYAVERRSPRASPNRLPPGALRRILELVEARLHTRLTLAELAQEAHVSLFHFSRLFRSSTGETPCRYVVGRRVARAEYLLRSATDSLAEIASAAGFSSQSHFSAVFRTRTGLTPAQYRRTFLP